MPRILTLPCVLLALATAACAGTRPVGVEALAPGMRVRAAPPAAEPVAGYILRRVNGMVGAQHCPRTERCARVGAPVTGTVAGTFIGDGIGLVFPPERRVAVRLH